MESTVNIRDYALVDHEICDSVTIDLSSTILAALEYFAADETDNPSYSEGIRRILFDWLIEHQYISPRIGEHS